MANKKEEVNISKMYGKESTIEKEEFIKIYNIKEQGLTEEEAQEEINKNGLNEMEQAKPKKWYHYLKEALFNPFNSILLGIAAVLFYTDVLLPEEPSYVNIIIIIVLVLISAFLEFFSEFRSNKAAEKLKEMVATTVTVIRNGQKKKILLI